MHACMRVYTALITSLHPGTLNPISNSENALDIPSPLTLVSVRIGSILSLAGAAVQAEAHEHMVTTVISENREVISRFYLFLKRCIQYP